MSAARAAAWTATLALTACSHPVAGSTPEGAVRAWLEHMEDSPGDPAEAREAFALLGPRARQNLDARAERAAQVEGRRTQAFEMVAEGRFGLRFRPKAMHATVTGDEAVVDVTGDDPETERARVSCVREPAGWHVEPELPEVTPRQRRGEE